MRKLTVLSLSVTFTMLIFAESATANTAPVVNIPIPDQEATAGDLFSYVFPIITFEDIDVLDILSYSFLTATLEGSSDGSWLMFEEPIRRFIGTPAYSDVGVLEVSVTATDNGGLSATDAFLITVVPEPSSLLLIGISLAVVAGARRRSLH